VDAVDSARVAFQGEPGAYSQRAVLALFGDAAPVPMHSLRRVFEAVEIGAVEFGVVPLENSHAGSINESYDLLVRHGLTIVAETIVRISHCLMAPKGTAIEDVKVVYSHSQALDQCEEFLDPLGVKCVAVHDTAGAARLVAESGEEGAAAIASAEAATLYGLELLAADVEDRADNSTKFVAVCRGGSLRFGPPEKTSIVFACANVPGALYKCLREFADRQVNLSKIESRPSRAKAWQYYFYLDFDTPAHDPAAQEAMAALSAHTAFLRLLGSYPRAKTR
jgi:prephenate dehydratase